MSENLCAVEDCSLAAPWTICRDHSRRLERDLAEVPAYRRELQTTLSRQTAIGERNDGGKSAEKALPYDARASEALAVLRSALVGWVRMAVEEDGAEWPADHIDAMAAFLLSRLGWLRTHQAGHEAVDEIGAAVGLARRVIDRPAEGWFVGNCECGEALYAKPYALSLICRGCKVEHKIEELQTALREALESHLGTVREISGLCHNMLGEMVTASMIRGYAYRGSIAAHGEIKDDKGQMVPLYRMGDVFAAATKAAADPQSRKAAKKAAREAEV